MTPEVNKWTETKVVDLNLEMIKQMKIWQRKSKALAQANIGIADAIEGLARANDPHVVKVREALQELECRITVTITGSSK
jgi:hypothetical protein